MDKHYVSEFDHFMNRYLDEHPGVVKEQIRGWRSFWMPEVDHTASHPTIEDIARNDGYGFYMPHQHINAQGVTKH